VDDLTCPPMWAVGPDNLALFAPLTILVIVLLAVAWRAARSSSRRHVAARWPSTHGTILMTTIQVQRTGTARREVPVVMYAYRVGQQAFQGSRIRVGDELGALQVSGHARNVLDRYPVGATVLVYYDPTNPTQCALER